MVRSGRYKQVQEGSEGDMPADSPPEVGVCVAGERLKGFKTLHEVVEVRPALCHLDWVSFPENLAPKHKKGNIQRQASILISS